MKTYCLSDNKNDMFQFNLGLYSADVEDHLHDFVEIFYALSGSGIHYIDNQPYHVRKGSMLYIDKGRVHRCDVLDNMSYVNFRISPDCFYDPKKGYEVPDNPYRFFLPERNNGEVLALFEEKECELIEQIIYKMLKENVNRNKGYEALICSNMNELLIYMERYFVIPELLSFQDIPEKLWKAICYIDEHCSEKITLKEVCSLCNYSSAYFYKMLKKYFGCGFSEYLMKKRINKAMFYLIKTEYPIEEIISLIGFTNKSYFYKTFKKYIGVKPFLIKKYRTNTDAILLNAIEKL